MLECCIEQALEESTVGEIRNAESSSQLFLYGPSEAGAIQTYLPTF